MGNRNKKKWFNTKRWKSGVLKGESGTGLPKRATFLHISAEISASFGAARCQSADLLPFDVCPASVEGVPLDP